MDDKHSLKRLLDAFKKLKVLVIGDVMVDAYIYGDVKRVSPEAPIPVVDVKRKEQCLGGAANVALNIHALGASAHLFSVIGTDDHGTTLLQLLETKGLETEGVIQSSHRRTTVKSRVISSAQHLVRFDEEDRHSLNEAEHSELARKVNEKIAQYDVIVFEDYDKGCISPKLIDEILAQAKNHQIPTVVDPKKNNFINYVGATLFKPNLKELGEGLGRQVDLNNLEESASELMKLLQFEQLIVTLSQHGIFYKTKNEQGVLSAHVRNIANVSGAGDTVIAVAALCLAAGTEIRTTAHLANLAGGIVCEAPGIVPIDAQRLEAEVELDL